MEKIKCVYFKSTEFIRLDFRRYCSKHNNGTESHPCEIKGYHTQLLHWKDIRVEEAPQYKKLLDVLHKEGAERWPTHCDCGYAFEIDDYWQILKRPLFQNSETSELVTMDDIPVGGVWYHDTLKEIFFGPDKKCLIVRTPGGDWCPDSPDANCGMLEDKLHKCWIRRGEPSKLSIDRNGILCSRPDGLAQVGRWLGSVQDGYILSVDVLLDE